MTGPAKLPNKMCTASVARMNSANKKYWKQASKQASQAKPSQAKPSQAKPSQDKPRHTTVV
jgi:hypothetical protein